MRRAIIACLVLAVPLAADMLSADAPLAIDGLVQVGEQGQLSLFTWNGRATQGDLVPPGTYLCRIDLAADAGDNTALRTIAVAY